MCIEAVCFVIVFSRVFYHRCCLCGSVVVVFIIQSDKRGKRRGRVKGIVHRSRKSLKCHWIFNVRNNRMCVVVYDDGLFVCCVYLCSLCSNILHGCRLLYLSLSPLLPLKNFMRIDFHITRNWKSTEYTRAKRNIAVTRSITASAVLVLRYTVRHSLFLVAHIQNTH